MEKVGVIAGNGLLPKMFLKEVKSCEVYIVGFKNFLPFYLRKYKNFALFNLGEFDKVIKYFKKNQVNKVVLLGYIPHKVLVENEKLSLDKKMKKMFLKISNNLAMSIFNALLYEFEKENINIEPVSKYLPHLFADKGEMTCLGMSNEDIDNIEFGYKIAKQIAELDIGLTIVVKNKLVVAVEGLEGTDECILRAKKLAGSGCYVIKVARPQQDMRFDLPVIGPKTVSVLKTAEVNTIAVESGKTLILEKDKVIKNLNKLKIKLYGI